jgi:hypothetical protein
MFDADFEFKSDDIAGPPNQPEQDQLRISGRFFDFAPIHPNNPPEQSTRTIQPNNSTEQSAGIELSNKRAISSFHPRG